jgi:MYXO-CTERM domain-containing protein
MKAGSFGKRGLVAVALALLPAAACDDADELPLDRFGAESARVICDKTYSCCTAAELMEHMNYRGGRAACGESTKAALDFWAAVIADERDKGRLTYDPRLSRKCLDSYAAATCDQHKQSAVLQACDGFIVARTAPGGACRASESCMGGACIGVSETSEGVCQAAVVDGQSCASAPCAKGTYCAGDKVCRRKKTDGETCNANAECQSAGCNGRNSDTNTPGTCGPKGGATSTCYVTTGCAYGGAGGPGSAAWVVLGLALLALRRRREARRPPAVGAGVDFVPHATPVVGIAHLRRVRAAARGSCPCLWWGAPRDGERRRRTRRRR